MRAVCFVAVIVGLSVPGLAPALAGPSAGEAALAAGDFPKARAELRAPAKTGNARAQFQLGRLLLVHAEVEGFSWIQKSAAGGHIPAQMQMARYAALGQYLPKNDRTSASWLEKIVEQARAVQMKHPLISAEAKLDLSYAYEQGKGVATNARRALALIREAADDGLPRALAAYAGRLQHGTGTPKDLVRAHTYYVLAWKAPHIVNWFGRELNAGERSAREVRRKLTSAQFEASRAQVRTWLDRQKAGRVGMAFQRKRELSRGLRKLSVDEDNLGWALILARLPRVGQCGSTWIKSRKAVQGSPDRPTWTERWTRHECGRDRTYTVRFTRETNRTLTMRVGREVSNTADFGMRW